jgi:hypothetical protein
MLLFNNISCGNKYTFTYLFICFMLQGLLQRSPLVRFRAAARVTVALQRRLKRRKEKRKKTEADICCIA